MIGRRRTRQRLLWTQQFDNEHATIPYSQGIWTYDPPHLAKIWRLSLYPLINQGFSAFFRHLISSSAYIWDVAHSEPQARA